MDFGALKVQQTVTWHLVSFGTLQLFCTVSNLFSHDRSYPWHRQRTFPTCTLPLARVKLYPQPAILHTFPIIIAPTWLARLNHTRRRLLRKHLLLIGEHLKIGNPLFWFYLSPGFSFCVLEENILVILSVSLWVLRSFQVIWITSMLVSAPVLRTLYFHMFNEADIAAVSDKLRTSHLLVFFRTIGLRTSLQTSFTRCIIYIIL